MAIQITRLADAGTVAAEPVTLAEAKAHLRIVHGADDGVVTRLVTAARQMCEAYTNRAIASRNFSLYLDAWPEGGVVKLQRPPVTAVSGVYLWDHAGASSAFAATNYAADLIGGTVALRDGIYAPQPQRTASGIEIRYTAGYASVPAAVKQAVLQLTAHLYMHRGDDTALAVSSSGAASLLQPYRLVSL
jgi:uncharacterized phiE125 gp8 family phage protein